ncbi:DUF3006 domain-containing protein, partial [Paenibacillus sp. TAF58]
MKGIVDRFEGDIAVIEIQGETRDFSKSILDPGIRAGDSVELKDGKWVKDEVETENRMERIKGLMDK